MELVGRVGRDGDIKYLETGTAILNFSIAVNQGYGEKKYTEWVKVAVFGKQAEQLSKLLSVGALVQVQAQSFKVEKWTTNKGEAGACLSVTANAVTILVFPGSD